MDVTSLLCEFLKGEDISPFIWRYYINKFEPGFTRDSAHAHQTVEINHVIDGTCFMDFSSQTVKIAKNNCLVISSNVPHRFYVENDTSCTLVSIHFDYNSTVLSGSKEYSHDGLSFFPGIVFNSEGYIKLIDYHNLEDIMKKIVYELDNMQNNSNILIKIYFCELFMILSRIMESNNRKKGDIIKHYISSVMTFIDMSLSQSLSPDIIAKEVHISSTYLLHIFKDFTGVSLMEYVNSRRIEKSKELLKNTNKKITQIAEQVGIPNSQYFSTIFKKAERITPVQYRKLSQMVNTEKSL